MGDFEYPVWPGCSMVIKALDEGGIQVDPAKDDPPPVSNALPVFHVHPPDGVRLDRHLVYAIAEHALMAYRDQTGDVSEGRAILDTVDHYTEVLGL